MTVSSRQSGQAKINKYLKQLVCRELCVVYRGTTVWKELTELRPVWHGSHSDCPQFNAMN